jgi:NADPH-dependent F420 reductase
LKLAIIGGTGNEGFGLGLRWAVTGHEIIIGSRSAEKAEGAAAQMRERLPAGSGTVSGLANRDAAAAADVVVLSVPYAGQAPILADIKPALAGKLLVTVVVPLKPPKVSRVWLPDAGSAAQEAQAFLGDETRVVAAFQNVSAEHLVELGHPVDCDVLVCGEARADRDVAVALAADAGMRGVHAGPLQNAAVAEGLTAVLIAINIRYKIKHAGIRITGLPEN